MVSAFCSSVIALIYFLPKMVFSSLSTHCEKLIAKTAPMNASWKWEQRKVKFVLESTRQLSDFDDFRQRQLAALEKCDPRHLRSHMSLLLALHSGQHEWEKGGAEHGWLLQQRCLSLLYLLMWSELYLLYRKCSHFITGTWIYPQKRRYSMNPTGTVTLHDVVI